MRSIAKDQGFTLIEVLICTAILAGALVMIYRPMLGAIETLRYVHEREEAERFMAQEIFLFREKEARGGGLLPPAETKSLLGRDKPFEFKRTAKPITSGSELYRIECQIAWKRSGKMKRLRHSFEVYVPKIPAAA